MSEFSESYHLRGSSRRNAVSLLGRAGLSGFVFPALDGWVTFVAEGEPFRPNQVLVNANEGVLLRWTFGEDHGWQFNVYNRKKKVLDYSCSWEDEVETEGKVSHAQLERELGVQLPALQGEIGLRILYPQSLEQVFEGKPAYAFASALGLTNYRWLSYDYLDRDSSKGDPMPPGVQVVK